MSCDAAAAGELQEHRGVRVLPKSPDEPFSRILGEAARQARGRYVYVIDSRAVATADTISQLVCTLDRDRGAALASSMICSASGSLREAGRTVDAGGKIRAEGAGPSESDSRFAFVRDVASASPASFIVRIEPLRTALSSAASFRSAAYVTADISFALRARGMRCVFQPRSRVLSDGPEDAFDPGEPPLFARTWLRVTRARTRSPRAAELLVLDEHVPFENRDAGSRRLGSLLRLARDSAGSVMFRLARSQGGVSADAHDLTQAGIESDRGLRPESAGRL